MTDIVSIAKTIMGLMAASESKRNTIFLDLLAEFPEQVCDMISQLDLKDTLSGKQWPRLGAQAYQVDSDVDAYDFGHLIPANPRVRFSTTLTEGEYTTVNDFLLNGQKVDAIKEIRDITKLGLKEAKDIVDQWSMLKVL